MWIHVHEELCDLSGLTIPKTLRNDIIINVGKMFSPEKKGQEKILFQAES